MAWNPAAYAPVPPPVPASPHTLTEGRDDTALFKDARIGFSHLLPGRPALGGAASGGPPADATVRLQDAPVTLRYRLEAPAFAAGSAAELARGTAGQYAAWRAEAAAPIEWANDSWLAAWGVEAAAVGAYELPAGDDANAASLREDLFVLVRDGAVLIVTWSYPRAFADDPRYATFVSIAEATMVWDRGRAEQHGRVWPDGPFQGAGLAGPPTARGLELAKQVASAAVLPAERDGILAVLSGLVGSAGAPWLVLAPESRDASKHAVLSAVKNARLRELVEVAFAAVRTAHDLRGLALGLGRALQPSRVTR
ncbi:MAG: hypothetical protein JWP97_6692 [Labilithrix sp.]|nr:hypothetical protein [Labilithrix sp.]